MNVKRLTALSLLLSTSAVGMMTAAHADTSPSDSEPLLAPDILAGSIDDTSSAQPRKELTEEELIIVDPMETINRATFSFNDRVDRWVLTPLAKGYQTATPDIVEVGVGNFLDNLGEPLTMISDLLQGKYAQAGSDFMRFFVNSTVGIFGFIDVGSRIGLEKRSEDFGQAVGYWGVPSGPYVVLPFLGPSTFRDAFFMIPQIPVPGLNQIAPLEAEIGAYALKGIHTRASLFKTEELISGDRYTFIRDAYLQNREFKVKDGNIESSEDEFFEDGGVDDLLFEE